MNFIDFPQANFTFGKPQSMTNDQCGALRVRVGVVSLPRMDGTDAVDDFIVNTSAWKPDEDDLKRLNDGGLIYLDIFGHQHPVVSVSTQLREARTIGSDPLKK